MNDSQTSFVAPARHRIGADERYEVCDRPPSPGVTPEQLKAAAKVGFDNADRLQAYFRASAGARND